MTYFEKHIMKYVVFVGLLVYLVYYNLAYANNNVSPKRSAEGVRQTSVGSNSSFWSLLGDMQRELLMAVIAVGGYILIAKLNEYLDRLESESAPQVSDQAASSASEQERKKEK